MVYERLSRSCRAPVLALALLVNPVAASRAGDVPGCTTYDDGNIRVEETCRDGLMLRRDLLSRDTGLPVRRESYAIRNGLSLLRQVKIYDDAGGMHVLNRRERHVIDPGAGTSELRRVRWTEIETGEDSYYDPNGRLRKRKVYDPVDRSLAWIVEYRPGSNRLDAVRRYAAGSIQALLFGEQGELRFSTDHRGYRTPLATSVLAAKSAYADASYPAIRQELRERGASLRLLFLGDSLTASWRGDGAAGDPVWQQYYASREAMPAGIGFERTEHLLWRLENGQLAGVAPEAVVLNIGTNNLGAGDTADETLAGVISNVARIRAALPQATIVLTGIFPRDDAQSSADLRRREVNRRLSLWSDAAGVVFRDLAAQFTGPSGEREPTLYADDVHLSTEGYAKWAEGIEDALRSAP